MKKSELLLNPYKEHLKKPYLHGAGTLEIDGVQYSADEYITMLEEANKALKITVDENNLLAKDYVELKEENKKLREELKYYKEKTEFLNKVIVKYQEENKKLKEEVEVWKNANKKLRMHDARMEYENEKLKETIKDHQLYEEKLEHRIIELEELLHGE